MSDQAVRLKGDRLSRTERIIAGTAGTIVTVDNDLATFAAILAAIGAAAALIAVLGIRFNTVKAAGAEPARTDTEGLAYAPPPDAGVTDDRPRQISPDQELTDQPISAEVRHGLGTTLGVAPVAVTHLTELMPLVDPLILRDYRSARKVPPTPSRSG